jgi:Cu/Ag efflux protein CusF
MKAVVLAVLLSLSGCAAYQLEPLSANHPASVEAVSAPERQVSKTLSYTRADVPSPTPMVDVAAAQQGGHEGHGGNQAEGSTQKMVTGEGKVVATVPNSGQLVVDHGEIKGFMEPMTMGYRVEPQAQLEGLKPGDQVRFTIDVPRKTIVKIEKLK